MGAVNFSLDETLVEGLKTILPLDVFIETGTFQGNTVEAMRSYFERIYSIELSQSLWREAQKKFEADKNITILHGDSREKVGDICSTLNNKSILFWLDAHWCVAENTSGEESQCPLIDELKSIKQLNEQSVILIDDARLFLAMPPEPHNIKQWPTLNEIIHTLRSLNSNHELCIVNDVIAFYPSSVRHIIENYARTYGIDWLRACQSLNENTALRLDLESKEQVIQQVVNENILLKEALDNKQNNLQEQVEVNHSLKLAVREMKLKISTIANLEEIQKTLQEQLSMNQEIHSSLMKMEHQIEKKFILFRKIKSILLILKHRFMLNAYVKRILKPRIGQLCQYNPRPLPTFENHRKCSSKSLKISIVTPSYEQAHYITETINSVFSQQYPNLEYFIQDGGSRDETVEILKKYESELSGWVSEPDNGQSHAINLGFAKTTGEIMAWLNSDDLLLPGALSYISDYFERHPDVDVVYGNRLLIDENGMEIGRWILPGHNHKVLNWADYIPQETLFWRRRIWDKIGGKIDETFCFAMDWDLLIRFHEAGAKFAHLPHFLGAFRIHQSQKTSAVINDIGIQEMDRIRLRQLGRVPSRREIHKAVLPFMMQHVMVDIMYRIKTRLKRSSRKK